MNWNSKGVSTGLEKVSLKPLLVLRFLLDCSACHGIRLIVSKPAFIKTNGNGKVCAI